MEMLVFIFTFFIALLCIFVIFRELVFYKRDFLNPIIMCFSFVLLFYLPKALVNSFGDELIFSYFYKRNTEQIYIVYALVFLLFILLFWYVGFVWGRMVSKKIKVRMSYHDKNTPSSIAGYTVLLVGFVISSSTTIFIIDTSISDLFFLVSTNRFDFFSSKGSFLLLLAAYKLSFFAWLFIRKDRRLFWIVALWAPSIIFDLVTGSRGKFIFENILPFFFILSRIGLLDISLKKILLILVCIFAFSNFMRSEFRGGNGLDEEGIIGFYHGPEAPYFDSLVLLVENEVNVVPGETILNALAYPVPKFIYNDKRKGASAIFTQYFFPQYYGPFEIEISFPFLSELYASFGFLSIIIGGFLGALMGFCYGIINRLRNPFILLFVSFALVRMVLLFRNDLFNNIIPIYFAFFYIAFIGAVYYVASFVFENKTTSNV